ncbi:uncharacterized protein LOC132169233 [Corylus avellana]|uniref:uncharacterized protein LOC132169233 n=1 Tax=Corylus avellana TaxID=13451 RepID=UPI00286AA69E|nr:uncharacterized protein LOC132169233 [Corylus avellana]
MVEELAVMCDRISLTEGEKEGITIVEGEIKDLRQKGERCIVGRIGSEKRINKEAFMVMIRRLWKIVGNIVFKELQDNMWLFEFSKVEDKCRVLEGRPWLFDRYILILNEFDGSPPSQMDFSKSPFWIQIHDMPLVCMNGGVGRKIGTSLGEVWDVDVAGDGVGWGSFLWVRVLLDLLKPLE